MNIERSIFRNINGLRLAGAPTSLLLKGPNQASGFLRLQARQLINDTPLRLDEGGRLLLRLLLLLLNNVL